MSLKRVQILDPILANQIAAGEVVERPASAAKELIENAIDAGATEITVEIKEGGRALLRVVDNGHGMSQADALLALERHATSKISVVDDLNRLHTLGFRGEALPSISSVSRFKLKTRTQEALMATALELEGGAQLKVSEAPGRVGTEVRVEDLFFNVPARRKFLKSSGTEGQLISEMFQRFALCHHQLACRFIKDGHLSFEYPSHSSMLERIEAMFGAHTASMLQSVSSHGQLTIEGLISLPQHSYSAHRHGYTFINDRYVKDRLFLGAIQRAYGQRLTKGRYPFYVLKVQINPSLVDVNVHPAKTEVRFVEEEVVLDLLTKALRGAVQRFPEAEEEEGPWSIVPGGLAYQEPNSGGERSQDEESEEPERVSAAHETTQGVAPGAGGSAIERHRALIRARIGGRVFEGERSGAERAEAQEPSQDLRHHRDRAQVEPSALSRGGAGRHEVLRVSQAELSGAPSYEQEPAAEPAQAEPIAQAEPTAPAPLSSPRALTEPLAELIKASRSEATAPPKQSALPPLLALAQPGALEALRAVGRAEDWWIQEASDGLLLTHLPSLYAHMTLSEPQPSATSGALQLTLSPKESSELAQRALEPLGVTLERFGAQSYRVTQLPQGFEGDWGGQTLELVEALLRCPVGDERTTWLQQLSQRSLSTSARGRALAWLSGAGGGLIERGEAPSCFVKLSWEALLKRRGGLPLF